LFPTRQSLRRPSGPLPGQFGHDRRRCRRTLRPARSPLLRRARRTGCGLGGAHLASAEAHRHVTALATRRQHPHRLQIRSSNRWNDGRDPQRREGKRARCQQRSLNVGIGDDAGSWRACGALPICGGDGRIVTVMGRSWWPPTDDRHVRWPSAPDVAFGTRRGCLVDDVLCARCSRAPSLRGRGRPSMVLPVGACVRARGGCSTMSVGHLADDVVD
jgi:hypothetical protein